MVEFLSIAVICILLISIKRQPPTPKDLNGLVIIVCVVGIIAILRLTLLRVFKSKIYWVLIGHIICGASMMISTIGYVFSILSYSRAILLENPNLDV